MACEKRVQRGKRKLIGPRGSKGFTLIELLIVVAIIGILAAIAIPNVLSARKRANYARAAADSKLAVTQAVVYLSDNNAYPGDIKTLRDGKYASVGDKDPWDNDWILSTLFQNSENPGTELHVCSKGPNVSGDCKAEDFGNTPPESNKDNGGVGFSDTHGSWVGK